MVEAGLGVAVLPTYAWAAARTMKISAVTLDPSIARDIAMITRTGRSIPPAVSAFARFLGKYTDVSVPSDAVDSLKGASVPKKARTGQRSRDP
jgi:DNA-binding transcriptional LysR family regulator